MIRYAQVGLPLEGTLCVSPVETQAVEVLIIRAVTAAIDPSPMMRNLLASTVDSVKFRFGRIEAMRAFALRPD